MPSHTTPLEPQPSYDGEFYSWNHPEHLIQYKDKDEFLNALAAQCPIKPRQIIDCPECCDVGRYQFIASADSEHCKDMECEFCNGTGKRKVVSVTPQEFECERCEGKGHLESVSSGPVPQAGVYEWTCPKCVNGKVLKWAVETEAVK